MIVVIDNFDSFVYNLVRYLREAGAAVEVVRNDAFEPGDLLSPDVDAVVLSPGPKAPQQAGRCLAFLDIAPLSLPVLGVCLGHQCIAERFGGRTVRAREPLHGEARPIRHDGAGLFAGLAQDIPVGRYHSLIADLGGADPALEACAWSPSGEVMAVRHRGGPWHGVQFHPESLLTPDGRAMIDNFLKERR